jgi:DNA invertase Pin-like site-specific DNA recombinase
MTARVSVAWQSISGDENSFAARLLAVRAQQPPSVALAKDPRYWSLVGIMAMVADEERRMISARTKAALAAAKRRGVKLGGDHARLTAKQRAAGAARSTGPGAKDIQASGATTLRAIADGLDDRGIPAARGGSWSATQVMRLLERIGPFDASVAAAAA